MIIHRFGADFFFTFTCAPTRAPGLAHRQTNFGHPNPNLIDDLDVGRLVNFDH